MYNCSSCESQRSWQTIYNEACGTTKQKDINSRLKTIVSVRIRQSSSLLGSRGVFGNGRLKPTSTEEVTFSRSSIIVLRGCVRIRERLALISIGWNYTIRYSFDFVPPHISRFASTLLTSYVILTFSRNLRERSRRIVPTVDLSLRRSRLSRMSRRQVRRIYSLDALLLSFCFFSFSFSLLLSISSSLPLSRERVGSGIGRSSRQLVQGDGQSMKTWAILEAAWN